MLELSFAPWTIWPKVKARYYICERLLLVRLIIEVRCECHGLDCSIHYCGRERAPKSVVCCGHKSGVQCACRDIKVKKGVTAVNRLFKTRLEWTCHVERAPLPPSPPVTNPRALARGIRAHRRPRAQQRFAGVVVASTTDAEQFGPNRERCRHEGVSGTKGPPSSSRRCVIHPHQPPHTASRLPKRCTHHTHALSRIRRCCTCPRAEPIMRAIGTRCFE